ncbi:MAG: hypothetical protein IPN34_00585 [Planctomycetes bacterium]|nr:hypothetical protein [Planctomycetota bacterium]
MRFLFLRERAQILEMRRQRRGVMHLQPTRRAGRLDLEEVVIEQERREIRERGVGPRGRRFVGEGEHGRRAG